MPGPGVGQGGEVAGGDIAEAQERAPEEVEIVKAMMETTVAPAKARRKSRPKKA